jgi:flavin-dependent dehydrogenase
MNKSFDLIVIGAGPTGLMAAKVAGENGLRVVLIEKKPAIPEMQRACGVMHVLMAERPAIIRKLQAFRSQSGDERYAGRSKYGFANV